MTTDQASQQEFQQKHVRVPARVWTFFATITAVGAETCEPDYVDSFEATVYLDEERTRVVGEVTVAPSRNEDGLRIIRRLDDQVLEYLRALPIGDWVGTAAEVVEAVDIAGYEALVLDHLATRDRPVAGVHVVEYSDVPVEPVERALGRLAAQGGIEEHAHTVDGLPTFALPEMDAFADSPTLEVEDDQVIAENIAVTRAVVIGLLGTCKIDWRHGSIRVKGGTVYFEATDDEALAHGAIVLANVGVTTWTSNHLARRLAVWTTDVAAWFARDQESPND